MAQGVLVDTFGSSNRAKIMKVAFAVIMGAIIIASAILFVERWQIAVDARGTIYRLNKWDGSASMCMLSGSASADFLAAQGKFGTICRPEETVPSPQ